MPNKAIDAQIFCPFYVSESALSITCEGIVGHYTVNKFMTETEKAYHENAFCIHKTCAGCGVYSALMNNYSTPKIRH